MIRGEFGDTTFTLEFDPDRGMWFLDVHEYYNDDPKPDTQVHSTFEEAMISVILIHTQISGRLSREADAEAKINSLLRES